MIRIALLALAITIAMVSGSTAQKVSAMDEVITLAATSAADFTADLRAKFAQSLAKYCQEVLHALPTNTPAEDAWVTSEIGNGAKIGRLLNSKEYGRSILKEHFSECKDTAAFLIQIQQLPEKGTETFSRLEAGHFIQLALNFNNGFEPYLPKVELNKDVKFALGDLQIQMIRWGLLKATTKALQDVHQ
jgi:hypothetical protein